MSATRTSASPSSGDRASASAARSGPTPAPTLAQQLGNQGLARLLRARLLQAKLTVSNPRDVYEQEADRVADQVLRMPEPTHADDGAAAGTVAQSPARMARATDAAAGAEAAGGASIGEVPTIDATTERMIRSLSGRGNPLPDSVRGFMEPRFRADFSGVRIHDDPDAHALARSVSAQAFTVGRDVVFGAGYYTPESVSGRRLLAHELTHTIQQGAAGTLVARAPLPKRALPPTKPLYRDVAAPGVTPILPGGSPRQAAERAANQLLRYGAGRANLGSFRLFVASGKRIHVYAVSGAAAAPTVTELGKGPFDLTTEAPPIAGIFVGGPKQQVYQLGTDRRGRTTTAWVGLWDDKDHPWITRWSTIPAQSIEALLPPGTIPVVVAVDPAAAAATATEKGAGAGSGGTGTAAHPRSRLTTREGKGTKPVRHPSRDEYQGDEDPDGRFAFPAEIKTSSALVPLGGANELTMKLDPTLGARNFADAVWNADTVVDYYWEVWNVTDVVSFLDAVGPTLGAILGRDVDARKLVAKAARQAPRDRSKKADDQFTEFDRERRVRDEFAHIRGSIDAIDDPRVGVGDTFTEEFNLVLAPVSGIVSAGGHLVDSIFHEVSNPDNALTRTWHSRGLYLVRCIAYPRPHAGQRYLPSVATAFIEVEPEDYIARNTIAQGDAAIDSLALAESLTADPRAKQDLTRQLGDAVTSSRGPADEALALRIAQKRAELRITTGRDREGVESELAALTKQQELARELLPRGPDGKVAGAFRAPAAFASADSGTTFPLLIQLVPGGSTSGPGRVRWSLFDFTTAGPKLGYRYTAERSDDAAAITAVLHDFAGDNQYGSGTVVLRIPEGIPGLAGRELIEKNIRRKGALARDRLADLATLLSVAGIGSAGAALAGIGLTAALAAERIEARWEVGTLAWDEALIGDLLSVLAAVTTAGVSIGGLVVREVEGAYVVALESGNVARAARLARVLRVAGLTTRAVDIANEFVQFGGIVWGEASVLAEIRAINRQERFGTLTHFEAISRRAKALLGQLQAHVAPLLSAVVQRRAQKAAAAASGEGQRRLPAPAAEENAGTAPAEREGTRAPDRTPRAGRSRRITERLPTPPEPPRETLPAILFHTDDGIRLITVFGGKAYYKSLGKSESNVAGLPLRKIPGEFYQFLGIQEVPLMTPPPGVDVPTNYERLTVGWYVKQKGRVDVNPRTELKSHEFQLDHQAPLTDPAAVNAWLEAHGLQRAVRDYPRETLKWPDPRNPSGDFEGPEAPTVPDATRDFAGPEDPTVPDAAASFEGPEEKTAPLSPAARARARARSGGGESGAGQSGKELTTDADRTKPARSPDERPKGQSIFGGGRRKPPRPPGGGEPPDREEPKEPGAKSEDDRKSERPPQRPRRKTLPLPTQSPSIPTEGENAPERLLELLEKGVDRTAPAPLATVDDAPASGVYSRGIKAPSDAYRAFNEAVVRSGGREVGIYYDLRSGEYVVIIGDRTDVPFPPAEQFPGAEWLPIVHLHPVQEGSALTFRWPSPADFDVLWGFLLDRRLQRVRAFVETHVPSVGRVRIEYGIDRARKDSYYIIIRHPDGTVEPTRRFESLPSYQHEYDTRTKAVLPGTPAYEKVVAGNPRQGVPASVVPAAGTVAPPAAGPSTKVVVDPQATGPAQPVAAPTAGQRAGVRTAPRQPAEGQPAPRATALSGEIDTSAANLRRAQVRARAGDLATLQAQEPPRLFAKILAREPGTLFNERLAPIRRQGVDAYNRGEIGNSVRDLDLRGKSADRLDAELKARGFTRIDGVLRDFSKDRNNPTIRVDANGKPVEQRFYVHPDGGMVRVKPGGDPGNPRRAQPNASKSVRFPPDAPVESFANEACKISNAGTALPASPADLFNPYPRGTSEHDRFADLWANTAHTDI